MTWPSGAVTAHAIAEETSFELVSEPEWLTQEPEEPSALLIDPESLSAPGAAARSRALGRARARARDVPCSCL